MYFLSLRVRKGNIIIQNISLTSSQISHIRKTYVRAKSNSSYRQRLERSNFINLMKTIFKIYLSQSQILWFTRSDLKIYRRVHISSPFVKFSMAVSSVVITVYSFDNNVKTNSSIFIFHNTTATNLHYTFVSLNLAHFCTGIRETFHVC